MQQNFYKTRRAKRSLHLLAGLLRPLLLSLGIMCAATGAFAQAESKKAITGTVVSLERGSVVPGASVVVKGTSNGTTTNGDGYYSIDATPGSTLVISFIGYETQEVPIRTKTRIDIQLKESISSLDEVVVVGYGEMKKTDVSSSQVTVSGKDLSKTINTSLEQGLQGRAANVMVQQNSGQPGAAPSVLIRGLSSLTGSTQPLYVIDGVQVKPENMRDDPNNHPTGFSNILSSINPDDIETINVLQGPSATAIYGAVGANGVVMITTKRGKAGEAKVTFNSLVTIQAEPKHIDVMNLREYAQFRNEAAAVGGTASEPTFADPSVLGNGTDWQSALFRPTTLQKYSLGLSGGTERSTYYMSGEYFNQKGIVEGSGFKRYNARLNLENQTRSWLKIGANMSVGITEEKVNTNNGGIIQLALDQNPAVAVTNPDGSWGGPTSTQFQFSNPVMISKINNDYNRRTSILGSLFADVKLAKNLVWHTEANGSTEFLKYYSFHPSYTIGGYVVSQDAAASTRSVNTNTWWSLHSRLAYDLKLGRHGLNIMAGHEAQQNTYESLTATRKKFITNTIQELSGGDASVISNVSNNSGKGSGSRESYFARVNYSFNERYFLQGTYRMDGSSAFRQGRRWGNFPAVSVAWRVSEEPFLKNVPAVNDLKLRFEVGRSGNQGSGGNAIYSTLQTVPTGWGTGFLASNFANEFLTWEKDDVINGGLDLHMFSNRVELIVDAYIKNITSLITVNSYPFTYGGDIGYSPGYLSWPAVNAGSMKNRGIGFTLNTVNIDKGGFYWKTGINLSVDRNKVSSLLNPITLTWNATSIGFKTEMGHPASMITGYVADGLFQDANDIKNHAIQTSNGQMTVNPATGTWVGDTKFSDLNGDGVIDAEDRTVIGNPWPKFTLGFNNNMSYKNFELNAFLTGSFKNDILNYPRYRAEIPANSGVFGNQWKSVANYAKPSTYDPAAAETVTLTNPGYAIPRIAPGDPNGNNRMSTNFIEDGTYVRLKNITLSYNLPKSMLKDLFIRGLKASVGAQNLFTMTKYKGYDPEIGMVNYGGTIMAGVDTGRYPSVRMYSFGLLADF
ncbi:SusC/RagA family TonB-linked outer membrane protein [Dyadobacter pollutisoli]|uniref:TonB-dependent receptor n=1 Tax=Dyadobacter pollutisoli TaxID=2910158 RepID=A0A9E8SQU5_9BACT|nr:TonB-dependent receptor [Dyadobacter pollutisoli]WAC13442.1 TonB-dependent receptor [Dyadobacter pollutisoli]